MQYLTSGKVGTPDLFMGCRRADNGDRVSFYKDSRCCGTGRERFIRIYFSIAQGYLAGGLNNTNEDKETAKPVMTNPR